MEESTPTEPEFPWVFCAAILLVWGALYACGQGRPHLELPLMIGAIFSGRYHRRAERPWVKHGLRAAQWLLGAGALAAAYWRY